MSGVSAARAKAENRTGGWHMFPRAVMCGRERSCIRILLADRHRTWDRQAPLYEILRVSSNASPTELRLPFRLRQLSLDAEHAPNPVRSELLIFWRSGTHDLVTKSC